MELLSLLFPRPGDLDHDARVYLVDKADSPFPDPVNTGESFLDIHHNQIIRE